MKAVGDRVKVISRSTFHGELGTVNKVFPADVRHPEDGYGILLDSDDDKVPTYFAHYELEEVHA